MMKELGAKWLVEVAQHSSENPQVIVKGFVKAGTTGAGGTTLQWESPSHRERLCFGTSGALDGHEDSAREEEQNESDDENDCAFE